MFPTATPLCWVPCSPHTMVSTYPSSKHELWFFSNTIFFSSWAFYTCHLPNSIFLFSFLSLPKPQENQNHPQANTTAEFLSHCSGEDSFPMNMHSLQGKCQQTLRLALGNYPLTDHISSSVAMVFPCIVYSEQIPAFHSQTAPFQNVCSNFMSLRPLQVCCVCLIQVNRFTRYYWVGRDRWTEYLIVRNIHIWRNMLNNHLQ